MPIALLYKHTHTQRTGSFARRVALACAADGDAGQPWLEVYVRFMLGGCPRRDRGARVEIFPRPLLRGLYVRFSNG